MVAPGITSREQTNDEVATPIRLCVLSFDSLPEFKSSAGDQAQSGGDGKTWFEAFVDGMSLKLLQGAYLLLFRLSHVRGKPKMKDALFGRTTSDGEIVRIDESELNSSPPAAEPPHRLG